MKQNNNEITFGKKELKELIIPLTLFICIVISITCLVAIYEACR